MFETYININTNEEIFIQEKSVSIPNKLLIILLILLSFQFAVREDSNFNRKLIKLNRNNYYEDMGLVNYNRYYLNNYVPHIRNLDFFNITHVSYQFSNIHKLVRTEFNMEFFEENENLISPSDLALYKGLQVMCTLEITNPNTIIYSYPHIVDNKYYQCIEYFDINEKITIGIKLYQNIDIIQAYHIKFFTDAKFNYNNFFYQNDIIFEPIYINRQYLNIAKKINENVESENPKLKSNYYQYPYCTLKRNAVKNYEKWYFRNIYNDHFCFCIGSTCLLTIDQNCKQYFLLSQIDKNQHLYSKTDYLFLDFIFKEYSIDDTYPVFTEMQKRNYPVHYMTENSGIYNTYCSGKQKCEKILYVERANYTINGDFVEKYFTLFLKLKAIICSRQLNFFSNIFYITDYITYILIGHSILYFRYFSEEKNFSEKRKFDKLILPPSEKVINLAKSFGWTEDDIIQINFPRWDKYNNLNLTKRNNFANIVYNRNISINISITNTNTIINNTENNYSRDLVNSTNNNADNTNNTDNTNNITLDTTIPMREERSIFMMFAWRGIQKDCEISNFYFDNITKILEDEQLNNILEQQNVKIYFTIHGLVINKYKNTYKSLLYYNKNIKFIEQYNIAYYIAKSELIITDFSSLMFDFVYMRRPYIFYIPDLDDPEIEVIYKNEYFEFYNNVKNGIIKFENLVFNVEDLMHKIVFYINNDFTLDDNIKNFYDSFGIKKGDNINDMINYLVKLK